MTNRRYSQQVIDRWMGALMASACDVDGEWVPNFHAVSRAKSAPGITTLRRWWSARDVDLDGQLRAASTRGSTKALQEEGAEEWTRRMFTRIRSLVEMVTDTDNYEHTGSREDEKGRTIHEGGRWADVKPDNVARAYKLTAETLPAIEKHLMGEDTGKTPNDRIRRINDAAKRAGLIE